LSWGCSERISDHGSVSLTFFGSYSVPIDIARIRLFLQYSSGSAIIAFAYGSGGNVSADRQKRVGVFVNGASGCRRGTAAGRA
jgi:hypothetical protein